MSTIPAKYPPGYKDLYRSNYYFMNYKCSNCKHTFERKIQKGLIAPKNLDIQCPNCGCRKLTLK